MIAAAISGLSCEALQSLAAPTMRPFGACRKTLASWSSGDSPGN
jgi:hypothetical protein